MEHPDDIVEVTPVGRNGVIWRGRGYYRPDRFTLRRGEIGQRPLEVMRVVQAALPTEGQPALPAPDPFPQMRHRRGGRNRMRVDGLTR